MNKKIFVPALLAAALSAAIPALAQDRSYQDNRNDRNSYTQRDNAQRDNRGDDRWQDNRRDDRYQNDRRDDRYQNDRRDNRYQDNRRDDHRGDRSEGNWGRTADYNAGYDGYGPDHNMRRGERLPSRYRNHQYVVNNWRAHHLNAPPRGQQWVQVGADYLLVAAATGLIVQAVSGN